MTEFDIVEYDFLKSIIKYDDMENYEKIPSDVIELRKEELNWSLLVTTLLKENRITTAKLIIRRRLNVSGLSTKNMKLISLLVIKTLLKKLIKK